MKNGNVVLYMTCAPPSLFYSMKPTHNSHEIPLNTTMVENL